MKAKSKQNIFDLTDQFFGDLNSVVSFAVDNDLTLNQEIPIDQELVVNNPVGTGNDRNKEAIVVQGLSFNNDQSLIAPPTPPASPVLLTAIIEDAAKADLVMTFDLALDETSVPDVSAFTVSDRTVSAIDVSGAVVTLTVTVDFDPGQVVTVGYTKPVSNPLKSTEGAEVASFAGQAVTNNIDGYTPKYQDVYNQFIVKPSEADAEAQNTFVQTLVNADIWSVLDWLGVIGSHVSGDDILRNWISPSSAVGSLINAPAWVQYQGLTGNGFNSYFNLNFDLAIDAVHYTQDSASLGYYLRTDLIPPTTTVETGVIDGSSAVYTLAKRNTGKTILRLNENAEIDFGIVNPNTLGLHSYERSNSEDVAFYKNGIKLSDKTATTIGVPSGDVFGLCVNLNGSPALLDTKQMSLLYYGGFLGPTKTLILSDAFDALMDYYGTAV